MTKYELLLKTAGLTKADFARLMGVTRVTVHQWVAGKYEPSPFHSPRLKRALETIQTAVDTGLLPGELAGKGVPRQSRLLYIKNQLEQARDLVQRSSDVKAAEYAI